MYSTESEDDIFERLENTFTEIDPSANTGQGTTNRAYLRTLARLLADNYEPALSNLYDAGYIETASGDNLDRRTNDVGIQRREATPATGVVEIGRGNEPSGDYTVPSGTLIQPPGTNVPTFETTTTGTIGPILTFPDSSVSDSWSGDTGSLSILDGSGSGTPSPVDGDYYLEVAGTSGATAFNTGTNVEDGDTVRFHIYPTAGSVIDCLYHVTDANNHYRVTTDEGNGVLSVSVLDGGTSTQIDSTSVTVPTGQWCTVEIDTGVNTDTTIALLDANNEGVGQVTNDDETYSEGHVGVRNGGSTAIYYDAFSRLVTAVDVEATSGGEDTNLGPDTLTQFLNRPEGITTVTNNVPTGDPTYIDSSGNTLVIGTDRETDDELRQRALDSTAIGGATTVPAIGTALGELDDVVNVRLFENDTLTDNTGSGGLPELSIEIVVLGGNDDDIGQTIFDVTAPTQRLYSGAHGSTVSTTAESEILPTTEDIVFSRPPRLAVDLTLDITVDDTYVGDTEIIRHIVQYIGGTLPDGTTATGTGVGENVRLDAIRDRIVGPETGVLGISAVSSTPSTTTDSTGLTIIETSDDEVAETDGTDGSVTLNVTEI